MTVIVFFKQELHCGEWFGLQLREKLSVDEIGYEKMVALLTSYSNPFKGNLCQSVLLGNIVARLTIYMIRLAIILKDIEYFWMGIFKIKHSMLLMVPIKVFILFFKNLCLFSIEGQTEVKCKLRSLFQITFDSYEGLEPLTEEGMMLLKTNKT